MRNQTDKDKVQRLLEALGREARGPGSLYLVGGASAVLLGWRAMTLDIDLKLDPEPPGAFAAIRHLKDDLGINVELASPDQFIPALPGWRERSVFIGRYGPIDCFHYDFYAQALAKIERGHTQDVQDIESMLRNGRVTRDEVWRLFLAIEPELERYPAIDAEAFRRRVEAMVGTGAEHA